MGEGSRLNAAKLRHESQSAASKVCDEEKKKEHVVQAELRRAHNQKHQQQNIKRVVNTYINVVRKPVTITPHPESPSKKRQSPPFTSFIHQEASKPARGR